MTKNDKSKEIAKRVFKKLEEKLPDIIEEVIEEYDLERTSEKIVDIEKKVEALEDSISNKFQSLEQSMKKRDDDMLEWMNKIFGICKNLENRLNNEIQELQQKNNSLEEELQKEREKNIRSEEKLKELDKTKEKFSECLEQKKDLEEDLKQKKNDIEYLKDEMEQLQNQTKSLEDFKRTIEDEKVMKLLEKILNNSALEYFRKRYDITDKSAKSIANLLKRLADKKVFVNSFYDDIVKYKSEHQEPLLDSEIEFYKEVNEFFEEEIFKPLQKSVEQEKFEKKYHRGINGETQGELSDDKALLIPSCSVEDRKIKVKLK